jgi:ribosomal protein S17E
MDSIQKELIKAGRKDLAQEYYKKVASELTTAKNKFDHSKTMLDKMLKDVSNRIEKSEAIDDIKIPFLNHMTSIIRTAINDIDNDIDRGI